MNVADLFVFAAIAAVAVATVLVFVRIADREKSGRIKGTGRTLHFPYRLQASLFSSREQEFLRSLDKAVEPHFRVFGQVRVADVVEVDRKLASGVAAQKAFNQISQKHFDFLICNPADLKVLCAIELNDPSHRRVDRHDRDALLRGVCHAARLPLLMFETAPSYDVDAIRARIYQEIGQNDRVDSDAGAPFCPECQARMMGRTAQKGPRAGAKFWGCSRYPACKGKIAIAS